MEIGQGADVAEAEVAARDVVDEERGNVIPAVLNGHPPDLTEAVCVDCKEPRKGVRLEKKTTGKRERRFMRHVANLCGLRRATIVGYAKSYRGRQRVWREGHGYRGD